MKKIKYVGRCKLCDYIEAASAKQDDKRAETAALHYVVVKAQFHSRENKGHIVDLNIEERAA